MRNLIEIGQDRREVWFYDGIITIIFKDPSNPGDGKYDYYADKMHIYPEFDEPVSLGRILDIYPTVTMVIFDDLSSGSVYRYNNHHDGEWEKVGKTVGYA